MATTPTPTDAGRWGQIATATLALLAAMWAVGRWAFDPLLDHLHRRRAVRVFKMEMDRDRDTALAVERIELTQVPRLLTLAETNAANIDEIKRTQERLADAVTLLTEKVGEVRGAQRQQHEYDRRTS